MVYYARGRNNDADAVRRIQDWLQDDLGISVGPKGADGSLGADTEKAIERFQELYHAYTGRHLKVDGVVGDRTFAALQAAVASPELKQRFQNGNILRRGDSGPDVRELQRQLNAAGYACEVDGDFGRDTEQKLRRFQKDHGLEPDGDYGPLTRGKLLASPDRQPGASRSPQPAPERETFRSSSEREAAPRPSPHAEERKTTVTPASYTPPPSRSTDRAAGGYRMIAPVTGRVEIGDSLRSTRYVHEDGKAVLDRNGNRIRRNHNGYDMHVLNSQGERDKDNSSSSIVAALPGEVFFADKAGSAGNMTILEHRLRDGGYVYSVYMHLNDRDFKQFQKGRPIGHGEQLGRMGDTGNAKNDPDGNHLHFAVFRMRRRASDWGDIRNNGTPVDLGPMNDWGNKTFDIVNGPKTAPARETEQHMADASSPARRPVSEVAQGNFFAASPPVNFTAPVPGIQGALQSVRLDPALSGTLAQLGRDGARVDDGTPQPETGSINRISGTLAQIDARLDGNATAVASGYAPADRDTSPEVTRRG